MTQPDLVSKLREFVRAHNYGYLNPSEEGKPGHYWCLCSWEGPDRGSYWKHLDEALLAESILGQEGQAAQEALCGTAPSATISTNEAGRRTAMDVSPSEELLSHPHRIVSHEQMESVLNEPEPNVTVNPDGSCSPSTPIVPSTPDDPRFNGVVVEVAEEFAILDEDIPALRQILARLQPALGLSAEQIASVVAANKLLPDPPGGYDMEGIAKDLNALLGAAKPAEPSISSGEIVAHDKYVALKTEAQIRKDVLREAFLLRPGLPHEWNSTQFKEGYYAGLEVFRQAIEKAIAAERPAPAGEARISRWQCPHCAHVNSMISANCENCKIPLVNTAR